MAAPVPRVTTMGMRGLLWVGGLLVLITFVQLYLLTGHTDRLFAWTIGSPLSATFIGAFYGGAWVIAWLSALEPMWHRARVGVPGVIVFIWLMLGGTLLHLGNFHLTDPVLTAQAAAWAWLMIYVLEPPVAVVLFYRQLRSPGQDPSPANPLPAWFRAAVAAMAVVTLGYGALLAVVPEAAPWPWTLTPLVGHTMAAWLLGFGVLHLTALRENDWSRLMPTSALYVALATLLLIAIARYPAELDAQSMGVGLYVAVLVTLLLLGGYGLVQSHQARREPGVRLEHP